MALGFNVDEILEMAIRGEENAGAFYRKAAGMQSDRKHRNLLEKLAAMEDAHKATFMEIRNTISDSEKQETVFDPNNELSLYLSAMVDSHGGEGSAFALDSLTGSETMEEILNTAIGLEKETVLFYLGLKDMVPPKYGRDKIDTIIQEERGHVAQLTSLLGELKTA
ncbi:MAG: ferritin family protein [Thermodesulfobacteriota bacterium]